MKTLLKLEFKSAKLESKKNQEMSKSKIRIQNSDGESHVANAAMNKSQCEVKLGLLDIESFMVRYSK